MEIKNGLKYEDENGISTLIVENGLSLDQVINALSLYDCFHVEFWQHVSNRFGSDILSTKCTNIHITEVLKNLFWFHTSNGIKLAQFIKIGYSMNYNVENDITQYIEIYFDGILIWNISL